MGKIRQEEGKMRGNIECIMASNREEKHIFLSCEKAKHKRLEGGGGK